jgi:RNA polymerase sigma-70 factor (ECF subfamily)
VHESVHAALAALPPEQREAVRLAYFQGLTHSEIARALGIPVGTVKTRLRLAFDKLRVSLASIKDWVL